MLVIAALPFMAACPAPAPTPAPTPTPTPTPTPAPAPAPEKVIDIKFATYYPVLHPMNYDCYDIWCKELDKRSDGKTKTVLYGGGSLYHPREAYDGVKAGMGDISDAWPNNWPGRQPISEMYHLPFIAPTASIAAPSLYESTTTHPEILAEWEPTFKLLGAHTSAIINLHTTADAGLVKSLEDVKGLRLAGDSVLAVEWFGKFGAAAERIDTHSAYLALEKGVIDGGMWPWAPLRSQKITDFVVNHTVIDLAFVFPHIVLNREKWESLPADIQKIIDDISGFSLSAFAGATLTNGSLVDVQFMKDKGDQFYTLPPDEKARWASEVAYTVDAWKEKAKAAGVKDPDKLWEDLHKIVAKWTENPYPEDEWWGATGVGRYGSPNRPGGWD